MCCHLRLCMRFTGLLLLTELLLLSAHAQTATPLPKIQEANEQHLISRTVHGADVEIPLTFVSGAQASGPFTVTVGQFARSDGFGGKGAKLSSTQSGKELVVGSNRYLSLLLEAELPEFTTYHSWIMLSTASESIVYDLKLQRRSIQLAFRGAKNNLLELSTSSRKIDVPITFELAEGQTEVKGLKLSISSFARMDGRAIDREKLTIVQPEPLYERFVELGTGGVRTLEVKIGDAMPRAIAPQVVESLLPSTQVIAASSIHFSTTPPLPPPPPGPPESASELLRMIERDDFYVQLISVLLAIAGGFSFLYLPNDTWGSCYDYIYAVLWGFGLNEAGKGILTSLANQGLWRKVPA